MNQVLVLEHAHDTPLAALGPMMDKRAVRYEVVNVEHKPLPSFSTYQAIIALGGPQHVGDDERYPYFREEEEFIRTAVSAGVPYLGICLGGQLLAHALGAAVGRHSVPELGFSRVRLSHEGRNDALFARLPSDPMVFLWHMDAFALPPGSTLLASSESTPHQAFRYGEYAYGLQYHIEVTSDLFSAWLNDNGEELAEIRGMGARPLLEAEWVKCHEESQQHASAMFYNFLNLSRATSGDMTEDSRRR